MSTKFHDDEVTFGGDVTIDGTLTAAGYAPGSPIAGDFDVTGALSGGTIASDGTITAGGNVTITGHVIASSYVACAGVRESNAVRVVTADANATIQTADRVITVSTTGAGTRTFTLNNAGGVINHEVKIVMTAAAGGGVYEIAAGGLTATLAAAGDAVTAVCANPGAGTWYFVGHVGAVIA
jgi:hypothetical protein